jgi:peptidoglycan/LPS O-acetylase OafA/YrhL
MLHREFKQTGRIDFWRFYRRRFQRLAPALALMVTVTLLVSILILSPFGTQQTVVDTAIGSVLFVANFVIALSTGGVFRSSSGV